MNQQSSSCLSQEAVPIVTIWVHGTKGTPRLLPLKSVKRFFNCKDGLHHWTETPEDHHLHKIAKKLTTVDPVNFQSEHFYLFGWSGILSFQAREEAAEKLYCQVSQLLNRYKESQKCPPLVRIITHSHGGNVTLLLAEMMEKYDQFFCIDELILLACPVQDRTMHLVSNSAFKKIYSIYSSRDLIQIADPQGAYKGVDATSFFSRRQFPRSPNLYQVMVRYSGRPIMHIEFLLGRFIKLLPGMLEEINRWHSSMEAYVAKSYELDLVLNIKG